MLKRIIGAIILPAEISPFERDYLQRMNRIALLFFWLHLPVFIGVAALCGTGVVRAFIMTLFTLLGMTLATRALDNPRHVAMVSGFSAMCLGGLLVYFGQGPTQIEMHFYFFVLLALLAVFGNPAAILVAAATAAVHHLMVYLLLPRAVFNYDASIWVVAIHALFVVLESVAACFVARSFFDNVIGLDKIVQQRTSEVHARNRDMRLVLDNVNQGLLTLNLDGTASKERSAILDSWLGPYVEGRTFWDSLAPHDPRAADNFSMNWDSLREDVLPLEIILDQFPKQAQVGGRTLKLDCQPIFGAAGQGGPAAGRTDGSTPVLSKLLVIISDMTEQMQREQAEAEQRELMTVFEKIMHNRSSFQEFVSEARDLVRFLTSGEERPLAEVKRLVHTLKGNCSMYGLGSISSLCHDIETRMLEEQADISHTDRRELGERWRQLAEKIERFAETPDERLIELSDEELDGFREKVEAGLPRPMILQTVASWSLQPTRAKLEQFADQMRDLSRRLGKGPVRVDVESNHLRHAAAEWAGFWGAFTHVVRNAVDHGLETPEERRELDKPQQATLGLRTYLRNKLFIVQISDDGRGIAWERVEAKARSMGLPCATSDEVVEALFADGLSTKTEVTEYSGRGVGLGAVRVACEKLGGVVKVVTEIGKGTTMEFRFPVSALTGDQDPGVFHASTRSLPPAMPPSYAAALRELGGELQS